MLLLETALPQDDSFLFEVYAETRHSEMEAWGWPPGEREAFLRMQFELQTKSYAMQYPGAVTQIIVHEGVRIGRMIVSRQSSVALVDLSLLAPYRNRGLGSAVIARLQQEAAASGRSVTLHVLGDNPAKRLYERLGFKVTGESFPYVAMAWQL